MKEVLIKAGDLKVGDVINGQRVNHEPIVSGRRVKRVNLFLISPHGYAVKPVKFKANDTISVKRPKYNLSKEDCKSSFDKSLEAVERLF